MHAVKSIPLCMIIARGKTSLTRFCALSIVYFIQGTQVLVEMLEDVNITVVENGTISFSSSTNFEEVTDFFEPELRIYFLNMYSNHARRILCAVSSE